MMRNHDTACPSGPRAGRSCSAAVAVAALVLSTAAVAGGAAAAPTDPVRGHELPAALATAVGRDLALSPAEYLRRADLAQRLAGFAADARRRFPGAVTGVELNRAGQPVVMVRPDAAAARVAARQAGFLLAEAGAAPGFTVAAPGTAPADGPLTDTLAATPAGPIAGGDVYVSAQPGQPGDKALKCSWAFNAVDRDGHPAALTAGHCNAAALAGSPATDDQQTFEFLPGHVVGAQTGAFEKSVVDGVRDYAIVRIADQKRESFRNNLVRGADRTIAITGVGVPVVGAPVCKSGATTGFTCGIITQIDQPDPNRPPIRFKHTALSLPGDSGGALVSGTLAMGIVSEGAGNTDPRQFPTDKPSQLPPSPLSPILGQLLENIGPHGFEQTAPPTDQFLRAVPQIMMVAQSVADVLADNPGLQIRTD
ncbi:S1 family peptidase [Nocardia terpenica]|uniref:S1 family peptidase n=1 Tax=Nocardia terpenica TaxID=455432 RepID=UPI000AF2EE58|nr:S1 family peptidase [Nocardia terpenica]NQE92592.1 hypothetical protein [Nocardia terpenica]